MSSRATKFIYSGQFHKHLSGILTIASAFIDGKLGGKCNGCAAMSSVFVCHCRFLHSNFVVSTSLKKKKKNNGNSAEKNAKNTQEKRKLMLLLLMMMMVATAMKQMQKKTAKQYKTKQNRCRVSKRKTQPFESAAFRPMENNNIH